MHLKNLWLNAWLELFCVWRYMPEHCGRNKSRRTSQRTELELHTAFLIMITTKA